MRPRDEMACVHVLACVNVMMGTPSVSNYMFFDISKFIYFVMYLNIYYI